MKRKLLVPLDGSSESEGALGYVAMLAEKIEVELELVRCFEPPATHYLLPDLSRLAENVLAEEFMEQKILTYLESKGGDLKGLHCDLIVENGDPVEAILTRAEKIDMIVMARHGRSAGKFQQAGGVTSKIVRSRSNPVLVVAGSHLMKPKLENILVCLDGSTLAEKALAQAVELAAATQSKLHLYRFVPLVYEGMDMDALMGYARDYLEKVAAEHGDLVATTTVRWTRGHSDIVEFAQEQNMDLIVMGSHGSRGIVRWLLGSVTEDVLHHAHCPILVVP